MATTAVVALCLLAAALLLRASRRGGGGRGHLPPGVSTPGPDVRALSPHLHGECERALREFAAAYRATFQPGSGGSKEAAGADAKAKVLRLHELRDAALGRLFQLRMRLPNDLRAEERLTQHIEDTDTLLRAYIADAQARGGQALLHPGPIDDLYYRRFYRAHNDVVE